MKTSRWFDRNRFFSLVRIASAGTFLSAAAAMAFVAAKPSGPFLSGKADSKGEAKLGAKSVRSKTFASHFQTLLGRAKSSGEGSPMDSFAQELYDNTAYPNKFIAEPQRRGAHNAANALSQLAPAAAASWQALGPNGVPASSTVVNESTAGTAATIFSGRTTAIAVAPNCTANSCTVFIGAAGGGVWKTTNALAPSPSWSPVSNGIPSNAIGSIVFDPNDANGNTLYAGTGEPNGSGDSEAGVGLYKSTNGGGSWSLVSGSTANSAPCSSNPGSLTCPVATGRSIGAIAIDPANASHIFIGTDVARHGSSSVNGGRFTPPGSAQVGLYESTDGGATFAAAWILPQDVVVPGSATGGDFFRGGCSHIELYRPASETQVYASFFDYGVFRRSVALDGDTVFHQVFASAGGGTVANSSTSRTEFSLAPNGANLRIYVGDAPAPASFWRVDNANVTAATLVTGGTNGGWTKLSNPAPGTPGFASYNYCTGQCTYDMPVYSPPGAPNIVYIGGAMQYGEIFTAHRPSNGRAVQRSQDSGVNFTDMTIDQSNLSRHPDQHAIAAAPFNPDIVFNADDGGVWRLNGSFFNASSQCDTRGLTGADLTDCHMWLSKIPISITSLNSGLGTLQYQSLSLNPANPLHDLLGGTQDNGTHAFNNGSWSVSVFGDGGQSGISAFNSNVRFHTYFDAQVDVNFHGDSETGWDWISDPFFIPPGSGEGRSFYIPIIYDPTVAGTIFTGLQHVWRTQDNGGNQVTLDNHCNELTGDFPPGFTCGDWVAIGQDLSSTAFGTDKNPGSSGYIVATQRAKSDTGTLWAGLRRGRVFVASNANAAAGTVDFHRIDSSAQPTRFVSGIDVDPANPNHAFISYSGYNAYATAAGTATGHVFEVTYNAVTHAATWSGDLARNLGDQPVTNIAVDWQTGDVYVSTDFGVFVRRSGRNWQPAANGLPPVAVYGLTINVGSRVLYAATHGRSAWQLNLQ
jgi:hypothetical protein